MARKLSFDRILFITCVGLAIAGLVMIFSASAPLALKNYKTPYFFLIRQSAACLIGLCGMAVAMHIDYRTLLTRPVVMTAVGASLLMLAGVLVADRAHMVHRWFRIGPIQIQPSELAKLALVLYLGYQVARREDQVNDLGKTILPIGAVVGSLAFLVYLEPDLGTAALYVAIAGILLFLAGLRWHFLALAGGAGAMGLAALIVAAPYRLRRITAFLDPNGDPLGAGFQVRQSILAVANGGIQGLSLGEGRQKLFFLPE
ncbi:MAG TPA: FtsW/RodA/SpoVE family cell cycle protein, partial [Candidatus Polarisedimenticolia bacterium]|nr:FtsW/RodA/SpoVE family cell cycle protein [Candidatus Polarisedimenticolia bacterium]